MRKWLYDRPWIWVVVFLTVLVAGSMVTLVIAQLNRPEIVKEKKAVRTTLVVPSPAGPADPAGSAGPASLAQAT